MQSFLLRCSLLLLLFFLPLTPTYAIRSGDTPSDDAIMLDGRYDNDELGARLSFAYPKAWSTSGDIAGGIMIASRSDLYLSQLVAPEDAAFVVWVLPPAQQQIYSLVSDPSTILNRLLKEIPTESFVRLSEVRTFDSPDFNAASVIFTTDLRDNLLIIIEQNKSYIVGVGLTAVGNIAQYEATFYAIARTIRYRPIGEF